ncbi:MAG: cobalamin-dependent protein, partial [Candidatus Omnitrophota bacterium]
MKILFIMPPMGAWSTYGIHRAPNQLYAQLASFIRKKKLAEVQVLDCRAEELNYEQMIARVKTINPDVVVLGDFLHSTGGAAIIWHFNETAKKVKEVLPKTKTIVAGIWYSALYKETLDENPAIDFVVVGEPELTFTELIENLNAGITDFSNVAGLASRSNGKVHLGPHRELIKDIDVLPLPAYDLFPMDKYVGHTYWDHFAELMTSRGCPGGCSFCYEWSQYDPRHPQDFVSWRIHSPKYIADELDLLTKKFGVKTIVFQDDAFNVNRQTVEELCRQIIKRKIKINWVILGRADDWAKQIDIFGLMKEA